MEIINLIFMLIVVSSSTKATKFFNDFGIIDEDYVEYNKFAKLFPPTCGQPDIEPDINRKIVNGEAAKPNSWPWQVSLKLNFFRHVCGGSIISNNIVLTAAHCVQPELKSFYVVVAGAHNLKKNELVQKSKVKHMILHDFIYNNTHILNDIAILFLESPFTFNEKVSSVCLPKKNSITSGICYTTGWGRTLDTGDSNILNQVRLPVVEQDVCDDQINKTITSQHLCAGLDKGKSGCHGDSGGPFVCLNTSDKRWYLHGITSFGNPMCNKISVFTRVVYFLDWIQQQSRVNQI